MASGSIVRSVLAVGIPIAARESDIFDLEFVLDPLTEAPEHASQVAKALGRFGYMSCASSGDDDEADVSAVVRQAITSTDGLLVVHIVSHGRLAETGERALHVVGADGRNLDDAVSHWISLIESHPDKPRPRTLFILDLCFAGAAATLPWHQAMTVDQRRAWVIAASGSADPAFGFRLSRATATVLNGYQDGRLRVDESRRYIPLPTVAREIDRVVADLSRAEGYLQQIDVNRVSFIEDLDGLPFFSNPGYRSDPSVLADVDETFAPMLDEAFDPRHFMRRAAAAEALGRGVGRGFFRGRDREVRTLAGWFNGRGPAVRVLTGKPGVGKSALLGVLICAAHPGLRDQSRSLWDQLAQKPARNERLAVVHARRRTLEQIADSLARQMGATQADRPHDGWDAAGLVGVAGASSGGIHTVVLDALDEADQPDDVTAALLVPLARAARDGAPMRLLVGTRDEPRFATLREIARQADGLINLDETDPQDLYEALRTYVQDLLVDTPYDSLDTVEAGQCLANAIAVRLTGVNDPWTADAPRPLGWGEFLVAGLYLRHVLDLRIEHDPERATQLGLAVPLTLPDLLELDLARRTDLPWFRPVLAALAHADGSGMPERVTAHVAAGFAAHGRPSDPAGDPAPVEAVREALDRARFYLRRDVDSDGTTLYRLFHEGLAERLRADPYGDQPSQERAS